VARRRLLRQSVPLPTSVSLLRRPELVVLSDAQTRDPVPMLAWVVRKFGFGQCHDLATPTRADLVLWPGRPDGQTGCVGGPPSVRPSCCHGHPATPPVAPCRIAPSDVAAKVPLLHLQEFLGAQHISARRLSWAGQRPVSWDRRVQVVSPGGVDVRRGWQRLVSLPEVSDTAWK
jgi:hypothetical protein